MFTFWARPILESFTIQRNLNQVMQSHKAQTLSWFFFLPLLLFTFYTSLTCICYCILLTWHNFRTNISYSGRSRGEAWAARAPPIFKPNWGPKGCEKIFLRPPPPLISGSGWLVPPYRKIWNRHWAMLPQACLAVDRSQPQSRHQSLLGQLKRNVLNQWRLFRKCFLSNIPCIPHCQTFITLKISKDFVNPHMAM